MQNLYRLLNKYSVEIPIIQRDYAQGRKDKRVETIRIGFVESLFEAIINPSEKSLHLDFIYGKLEAQSTQDILESNYNNVESILAFVKDYTNKTKVNLTNNIPEVDRKAKEATKQKIQPLDGQQRLTTLWIVHFILYSNSKLKMPEWLDNFTYKTRTSSTEFIKGLLTNSKIESCKQNSKDITNSKWFYKVWEQDPTVKGILVTIDEVQRQLDFIIEKKPNERAQIAEQLISNLVTEDKGAVNFSFLSLEDIDVEDDIYIKMNDRGKQLTDFEIFKNDLLNFLKLQIDQVNGFTIEEYNVISKKLDLDWLDLFWNNKDINCFDVEFEYHYFILYHILLFKLEKTEKEEDTIDESYYKDIVGENAVKNLEHLNFSYLKDLNLISLDSLKYVFKSLDTLIQIKDKSKLKEILESVSFKERDHNSNFLLHLLKTNKGLELGYYDRVFNYALVCYIRDHINNIDYQKYKSWCRILQNLIYNQAYIQGKKDFELAVRNINSLLQNGADIEKTLLEKAAFLRVFARQRDEEIQKIQIYKKQPDALSRIIKLEKTEFFQGQIQFVLDLSTINDDKFDLIKFIEISEKMLSLFKSSFSSKSEWLLQRAMLTKDFNFKAISSNRREIFSNNFSSLRLKEEGWRWLFKHPDSSSYRDSFRQLIDQISIGTIEKDLEEMVEDYNQNNWKYFFIKEPDVIRAAESRIIKFSDENNIRLLTTKATNGRHSELRTKYLQHNNKFDLENFPFKKIEYHLVTSQSEKPCLYFYDWKYDDYNYHFDIRYLSSAVYELRFLNNSNESLTSIEKNIKILLETDGFELKVDYGYIKLIKNTEDFEVFKFLNESINSTLSKLNSTVTQ